MCEGGGFLARGGAPSPLQNYTTPRHPPREAAHVYWMEDLEKGGSDFRGYRWRSDERLVLGHRE